MSEDGGAGKVSGWVSLVAALLTRPPTLLLLLGVALVLGAATGGWRGQVEIADPNWKYAVALLGLIAICAGGALFWRAAAAEELAGGPSAGRAKAYGLSMTLPSETHETVLKRSEGRPYFEAEGTVKSLPADAQIWVCIVTDDRRRWPHGPAKIRGEGWTVYEIRPGAGARKNIEAYVVGRNGQALIRQYQEAGKAVWAANKEIKARYPGEAFEIKTPPMTELTTDMVKCAERVVSLANNA